MGRCPRWRFPGRKMFGEGEQMPDHWTEQFTGWRLWRAEARAICIGQHLTKLTAIRRPAGGCRHHDAAHSSLLDDSIIFQPAQLSSAVISLGTFPLLTYLFTRRFNFKDTQAWRFKGSPSVAPWSWIHFENVVKILAAYITCYTMHTTVISESFHSFCWVI